LQRAHIKGVRPFIDEFHKIRALARAVGLNPHRWGLDQNVRKGVLVAALFVASMVVVALALSGLKPPLWFFLLFPLPVLAFAFALMIVVSAQSRDEERIRSERR
jgi:hypothetical protein